MSTIKKIGFIGTGVMGKSMAQNLHNAGHELYIYTRTQHKADDLLNQGAQWCDSPRILAQSVDIIITIVGFPHDVAEIYFGSNNGDDHNGIIEHATANATIIDMTTSEPQLAIKIHQAAQQRKVHALDAPVSGGDLGAQAGTLSIMVGGDSDSYTAMLPIFECMGKNIVHQGPAGSGQHTKMANQIAIASGMIGVCEAIAYAQKSGLDAHTVLTSISGGAAGSWALSNLAPRMIAGDFDPGFYIKHFIKDMGIAQSSAQDINLSTPGLDLAKKLYQELAAQGSENEGTQALLKLFTTND